MGMFLATNRVICFILLACLLVPAPVVFAMSDDDDDDEVSASAPPTSTISTTTKPTATVSMPQATTTTPLAQKAAQMAAAGNYQQGASYMSAIGIVSCAEGANTIQNNPQLGGLLVDNCLNSFNAANQMNDAALKAAQNANTNAVSDQLTANKSILDAQNSKAIMEDLKKKYGVEPEDFEQTMLDAKGNANILGEDSTLNELFQGKVTRSQIANALKAAHELTPEEREELLKSSRISGITGDFEYDQKKGGAAPIPSSIADKTPKAVAKTGRQIASADQQAGSKDTKNQGFIGTYMSPVDDPLFSNSTEPEEPKEAVAELTIFDQVSRKYRERFKSFHISRGI